MLCPLHQACEILQAMIEATAPAGFRPYCASRWSG
jgi:hypothetical protein